MTPNLTVAPTSDPSRFRGPDGALLTPPDGWAFLPAGDPGLTRRVKSAGAVWVVAEKRGRKVFTRGLWAPAETIDRVRRELTAERADPAYARKRAADAKRRAEAQEAYADEFRREVLAFLGFAPAYAALAERLADAVTAHATPVGSGTVARTKRLTTDRKAEAAVIAWLRHQTTDYDRMKIARVKGRRRQVRRELAEMSRSLLGKHRNGETHAPETCSLCRALRERPDGARPVSEAG